MTTLFGSAVRLETERDAEIDALEPGHKNVNA
jgi:hypothetical protein